MSCSSSEKSVYRKARHYEHWERLQESSVTLVSDIVEVMRSAQPDPEPAPKRIRAWVSSKKRKIAFTPATVSRDQAVRIEAARPVVELSWTWASTGFGLGHDVPEFMAARRREAQPKSLGAAFESTLLHEVVKVWQKLGPWV